MDVGHGVLADGNMGGNGFGSPVVVSMDGFGVKSHLVVEDSLDMMVVSLSLHVLVVVHLGNVDPLSVDGDIVCVLDEDGLSSFEGVMVARSPVALHADSKFVSLVALGAGVDGSDSEGV